MWGLALNITAAIVVYRLMICNSSDLLTVIIGIFLVYINIVYTLINIKRLFY
jgi:uncharacterized membrane protein